MGVYMREREAEERKGTGGGGWGGGGGDWRGSEGQKLPRETIRNDSETPLPLLLSFPRDKDKVDHIDARTHGMSGRGGGVGVSWWGGGAPPPHPPASLGQTEARVVEADSNTSRRPNGRGTPSIKSVTILNI